jgi:large subunit ribosomal protein L37Ae
MTRGKTIKGLGARYGATLRKRYTNVYMVQKAKKECPSCSSMKLKRVASGIWRCRVCGHTLAGVAYDVSSAVAR